LASALRQAGLVVEVHDDYFQQDATDEEWLTEVGQRKWVVLTKDDKIRYHARELSALVSHGVRAFILTARGVNADEMGSIVLGARPKIEKFMAKHPGPFMVAISRSGALGVLWPKSGRKKSPR
jgi:predicted nuclease of predicted toxin-antitoxin system